jgi:Protein of unknown function (DUF1353)
MVDKKSFMQSMLAATKDLGIPVPITPFADWDYFYINAELEWKADNGSPPECNRVCIPRGFVTDLASTPQILWSMLPRAAAYSYPAIIHDYLYWFQPCDRTTADDVFRTAMTELKISKVKVLTLYAAVRTAGANAWDGNARDRASGERRILKEFPEDAATTWAQWRSRAGVFAA